MSLSDLTLFNVHDGYCEAIVRGFRSGFLTDVEYHHLTECATMEGAPAQGCAATCAL